MVDRATPSNTSVDDDSGEFRAAGEESVCQEGAGEGLVAKKCHQVARHIAERGQRLKRRTYCCVGGWPSIQTDEQGR